MNFHQSRLMKITIASFLGIFIFANGPAMAVNKQTNEVYAKTITTYKIVKGKLVDSKSSKVIKGYAVYNNKLYYNGNLKKGYAVYSNKLYYNGSLKSGYVVYSNKLYYNGNLKSGYAVYSNKLYYNGSLKSGYAVYSNILYYNGSVKLGYVTYSSKFYCNGVLFTGTYNSVYYKSGVKFTGMIGNAQYKDGVMVKTAPTKILSISVNSGSIISNVTITTSADVYKVMLGSQEMHYEGKNTFTFALTNVKNGAILTFNAFDDNNKLLQSMNYTFK